MTGRLPPAQAKSAWLDFDVAVHVPVSENCGGVIEPLMAGVPVVAARTGGLPEVILDGVTGTLVEPRDPAKLADAIESVLGDLPRHKSMAEVGKRLVSHMFDVRRTAAEIRAIYDHVLNPAQPKPQPFDSGNISAGSLICCLFRFAGNDNEIECPKRLPDFGTPVIQAPDDQSRQAALGPLGLSSYDDHGMSPVEFLESRLRQSRAQLTLVHVADMSPRTTHQRVIPAPKEKQDPVDHPGYVGRQDNYLAARAQFLPRLPQYLFRRHDVFDYRAQYYQVEKIILERYRVLVQIDKLNLGIAFLPAQIGRHGRVVNAVHLRIETRLEPLAKRSVSAGYVQHPATASEWKRFHGPK